MAVPETRDRATTSKTGSHSPAFAFSQTRFFLAEDMPSQNKFGLGKGERLGVTGSHKFTIGVGAISADPPCPPRSAAAFVVNSESHTGARPSVRLCVGLMKTVL